MYAVPGGLIAVGLRIDPFLTCADSLVGQIIGHPGSMPEVLNEIEVSYYLLTRLLGVRAAMTRVQGLRVEEKLMINVGSQSIAGTIVTVKRDTVRIEFHKPICANLGEKIAMSRRVDNNFRLIGWGEIKKTFSRR